MILPRRRQSRPLDRSLARALAPTMLDAGRGAIMVAGNTAAFRGIPNYAVFSPTRLLSATWLSV